MQQAHVKGLDQDDATLMLDNPKPQRSKKHTKLKDPDIITNDSNFQGSVTVTDQLKTEQKKAVATTTNIFQRQMRKDLLTEFLADNLWNKRVIWRTLSTLDDYERQWNLLMNHKQSKEQ